MTMSFLRAFSLRRLVTTRPLPAVPYATILQRLHASRFSSSPIRTTEIPNKSQLDAVTKALQGSNAWSTISNNQEIQQLFVETAQVLREEGMHAYMLRYTRTHGAFRCRPCEAVYVCAAQELKSQGANDEDGPGIPGIRA